MNIISSPKGEDLVHDHPEVFNKVEAYIKEKITHVMDNGWLNVLIPILFPVVFVSIFC